MMDTLIKKCLASYVKYPEKPKTKGDILRYALYIYLRGGYAGLCNAITDATEHYYYKYDFIKCSLFKISEFFPLFSKKIAIRSFKGSDSAFWWPTNDWKSRYKYMKWLIKKYDKVEL